MTKEERAKRRQVSRRLAKLSGILPAAQQEFLLGYAEGYAAMKAKLEQTEKKKEESGVPL